MRLYRTAKCWAELAENWVFVYGRVKRKGTEGERGKANLSLLISGTRLYLQVLSKNCCEIKCTKALQLTLGLLTLSTCICWLFLTPLLKHLSILTLVCDYLNLLWPAQVLPNSQRSAVMAMFKNSAYNRPACFILYLIHLWIKITKSVL